MVLPKLFRKSKEKLNIGILSRGPNAYSTKRFVEAAQARGHDIEVIDTLQCYMNIEPDSPSVHYQGRALDSLDAVIPRIGASVTFYGTAVLRQFEMSGTYSVNSSIAISRSRDKLRSMQLLSRKGVGLPRTGFAHSRADIPDLLEMIGEEGDDSRYVIKLLEGTQGIGVVLAENKKTAQSMIEAFMGIKANIMVQEFIEESKGADIRCLVLGDKVVAAMKRQAPEGEFRSNLHRGGSASLVELSAEEQEVAINAAKEMGLILAGVDILRSNNGPMVIEVNSSPGLEGIETATDKDIAGMVIEYIENNCLGAEEAQG